jgi:hypothetical protein
MNSNFRKYYFKDRNFYLSVLDAEDPGEQGYEFKIHLFKGTPDAPDFT